MLAESYYLLPSLNVADFDSLLEISFQTFSDECERFQLNEADAVVAVEAASSDSRIDEIASLPHIT